MIQVDFDNCEQLYRHPGITTGRPEWSDLWPLGNWDTHDVWRMPRQDKYVVCYGDRAENCWEIDGEDVEEWAKRHAASMPWCARRAVHRAKLNMLMTFQSIVTGLGKIQASSQEFRTSQGGAFVHKTCGDAQTLIGFLLREIGL